MAAVISNPNSPDGMFTYEEAQAHANLFQGGTYYYSPFLKGYILGSQPAHIIDPSMFSGTSGMPPVAGNTVPGRISSDHAERKVRRMGWVAE